MKKTNLTKSSREWLERQDKDPYVKRAKQEGYRSRAAYKLLEINQRDKIINHSMTIIDLGAAPGGWCQVAKKLVGSSGKVIALDVLSMPAIPGVEFIQGDFTEEDVYHSLKNLVAGRTIHVVLSDMAPNMSGQRSVDIPKSMYLVELACDFAFQVLSPGGTFLAKAFQGAGFTDVIKNLRENFASVVIRKPDASRKESNEVYILAKKFKASFKTST